VDDAGRDFVEGTPAEVIADPRVVSSYLGGDMATINRSGAAPVTPEPSANGHATPRRRREPLRAST